MLISIILTFNDENDIPSALDSLANQPGDCEIILVHCNAGRLPAAANMRGRVVSVDALNRAGQYNAGAGAARGEVLLFLDARYRLPDGALLAIERNLGLLPQTIGGNFHVKFQPASPGTALLAHLLKWWRYRGFYSDNSGIFVRGRVFAALGGFRPNLRASGYEFAYRLEQYGPTLYLPEAIVGPRPRFWEALAWLVNPIFIPRN